MTAPPSMDEAPTVSSAPAPVPSLPVQQRDVGTDLLAYARPEGGGPDPRSAHSSSRQASRISTSTVLQTPAVPTLPYPRYVSADLQAPLPAASVPPRAKGPETIEQLAALPPLGQTDLSLGFEPGRTDLDESQDAQLRGFSRRVASDGQSRIQIVAYADIKGESGSAARRVSLSRALAVRARLLDAGVESMRIDVRALGNQTNRQPLDRVDLAVVAP